jgi:hypothetical protein
MDRYSYTISLDNVLQIGKIPRLITQKVIWQPHSNESFISYLPYDYFTMILTNSCTHAHHSANYQLFTLSHI